MKLLEPLEQNIFQPLESEMAPVVKYLSGRVLNAGCGNRDISALLERHAQEVDNCDLQSSLPGAILCDLTSIPRPDACYDTIFCNAVLEHVQFCDRVMAEFCRLLKPGGSLILAIPFLQPFHPCPTDFRRFTRDGLIELGQAHGLETVEVLPVHSMAQTVTWIVWACLTERRRWLLKGLLKVPLFFWCRLSSRTDFALKDNANTFQIVLRKPAVPAETA